MTVMRNRDRATALGDLHDASETALQELRKLSRELVENASYHKAAADDLRDAAEDLRDAAEQTTEKKTGDNTGGGQPDGESERRDDQAGQ